MLKICAYCKKSMGKVPPLNDDSITHGICDPCLKEQLKRLPKTIKPGGKDESRK